MIPQLESTLDEAISSTYNYVEFNDELWIIISVSNVKASENDPVGERRVKIIRNDSLGNYSWDSSASNVNSGYGVNDCSTADLNTELNTLYYNRQSGTCYNEYKNSSTICDFTSTGLSDEAKTLIDDALWYLGGSSSYTDLYANDYYNFERGTTVWGSTDGQICNDGACPRTTKWIGKIGLMYPSDYAYATDLNLCKKTGYSYGEEETNCLVNNWLLGENSMWTISPYSDHTNAAFFISSWWGRIATNDGIWTDGNGLDISEGSILTYPIVYLKSNVTISGGSGTSGEPYQLLLS